MRGGALIYILGLLILAMGLTLNTKAGLGVSPIISVSYSILGLFQLNFGNMTLMLHGVGRKGKLVLLMDLLQIPLRLLVLLLAIFCTGVGAALFRRLAGRKTAALSGMEA